MIAAGSIPEAVTIEAFQAESQILAQHHHCGGGIACEADVDQINMLLQIVGVRVI